MLISALWNTDCHGFQSTGPNSSSLLSKSPDGATTQTQGEEGRVIPFWVWTFQEILSRTAKQFGKGPGELMLYQWLEPCIPEFFHLCISQLLKTIPLKSRLPRTCSLARHGQILPSYHSQISSDCNFKKSHGQSLPIQRIPTSPTICQIHLCRFAQSTHYNASNHQLAEPALHSLYFLVC